MNTELKVRKREDLTLVSVSDEVFGDGDVLVFLTQEENGIVCFFKDDLDRINAVVAEATS